MNVGTVISKGNFSLELQNPVTFVTVSSFLLRTAITWFPSLLIRETDLFYWVGIRGQWCSDLWMSLDSFRMCVRWKHS